MDGFLLYLYGVVAAKQVDKTRAIHLLIESVNKYPYNWSAWLELASCLSSQDMVSQIKEKLPANSFMTSFFMVHIGLEIHSDLDAVESRLADLMKIFPDSIYLQSQIALAKYNNREFEDAAAEFEEIIKKDPFNLDQMDIYSNTLYVMEKKAELSFLAHSCALVDRYRPETCLVIGNYYSMRGDHAKAVMYYQRALKLNRHFLAAWTLMGHEYVEMKNTPAAIEAYRRAIGESKELRCKSTGEEVWLLRSVLIQFPSPFRY